ncbi:MAG: carboxypeptidase-like regulatory domain-containing protein, partial [Bacteroidetes bacterium]|nr:carboxypeptidase-like regulatory domain-containing protein [Bacteroidota bacterium]
FILAMAVSWGGYAQDVVFRGVVNDSASQTPIHNASITIKGLRGGARSNSEGHFRMTTAQRAIDVVVSSVGYNPVVLHLDSIPSAEVVFTLSRKFKELEGALVKNKRQKYRNKGNPAVELIRQVIDHKDQNRMEAYTWAQYGKYEKLVVYVDKLNKIESAIKGNRLLRPYHFLVENSDTTKLEGRRLSPVYLEETYSDNYYRQRPEKSKSIITGKKRVDYGELIDMQGISAYLNRLYQDFNVYDNNISVFTNLFLSPIADLAPTFYMYFIEDTTVVDGTKLIRLSFRPRNPNDLLFRGTMWVTLDGNYAIQKLRLLVSKSINFNFVREMWINQDFTKREDGRYLLTKSDVLGDFGINKKGTGLFGERVVTYLDFKTNQPLPDSLFKGPPTVELDSAATRPDSFWVNSRADTLTGAESKTYANVDSLKNMKSFKRLVDWSTLLMAGYKQANWAEIGPVSTFYSFNPVEGFRLRFGGRTTTHFSTRFYSEAYVAYGFKDQKWKYFLSGTYSINNKSIYGFPQNFVRASYQQDTKIPGQELQFVQEDNFLLSFKRGNNDKWLYNNIFRLEYQKEYKSHFSYDFNFKWWKQQPAGTIAYIKPGGNGGDSIKSITTTEGSVELRYAPHEQFYIGKLYRVPIYNKYPIISLMYTAGVKGPFGGEYNYHNLQLLFFKRFYEGPLGYTDITTDMGYLIGKVPFPLLDIHHANQTFALQLQSYNLMNFLEFVSDHYASAYIDHYFNGFFFNKIPLLKELKWREVIEAKILYGGVRDENNPLKSPDVMKYPLTNGKTETFSIDKKPYIEGGFGIMNIFKVIRVDYIQRFTYTDHPEISKWGIRARAKFDF